MVDDSSGRSKGGRKSGISRRDFLKGGSVLAGAAAVGATLGLASCNSGDEPPTSTGGSQSQSKVVTDFDVFDTEVLVLGGGLGGSFAAIQAYKDGCQVMVVDKGPFKFSGAGGLNWDAGSALPAVVAPTPEDQKGVFGSSGNWVDELSNKKLGKKAVEWIGSSLETWNKPLTFCRMGNTAFWRKEDGSMEATPEMTFTRHPLEYLDTHTNVEVTDNTMITELFLVGGKCTGAIGIHLPTGRYRVFRARATIIANGGSCQMYGWSGASAISINSQDNTGDVDMAAFRNGCALISPELIDYDMINIKPPSVAGAYGAGLGADSISSKRVCDSDGVFFFAEDTDLVYHPINVECQIRAYQGKGGENGCMFLDFTQSGAEMGTRPLFRRNIELWKKIFGIDVTQPGYKVEIGAEPFEHLASPVVDENTMTEIPGLFNVRGIGNKLMLLGSHWMAAYAGHCAAEYAKTNEFNSNDWSSVEGEIARLEEILAKDGSVRPHEIRHAVQYAVYDALHIGANADGLNTAIAEVKRIRDEDLPKMMVANKTRCYNTDWRRAIENYNIIDLAIATLEGTLMREETRGFFYRQDFPEQDDANWLKNILVKYNGGDFEYSTRPVVEA
jgi:succinate dehydrogenase / fumarate reductase flavoprotein subunit